MTISGGVNPQIARLAQFDRSPVSGQSFSYASGAPHLTTTRISYTVPANRLAILMQCLIGWRRTSAATTPATIQESINYTPNGGAVIGIITQLNVSDNTIPTQLTYLILFPQLLLRAGDNILANDVDNSVGGTSDQITSITYTEFGV